MSRARGWMLAFLVSGPLWFAILLGVSTTGHPAQPPRCRGDVCQMHGPGGYVRDWVLHVQLALLEGKRIVVPANATCASACAIAIGVGLGAGGDISISPSAVFIPHNLNAIKHDAQRMPAKFRKLMLAYKPFRYKT